MFKDGYPRLLIACSISPGRKFRAENQTPVSMAMHGALGVAVKANQRLSHV